MKLMQTVTSQEKVHYVLAVAAGGIAAPPPCFLMRRAINQPQNWPSNWKLIS